MPEVAPAGERHRDPGPVSRRDHRVVADRAAGLDDGGDAGRGRGLEAVGEGEEGVRGERRSVGCPALAAALRTASSTESTRLIWPAPMPTVAPSRASTIAFELTWRTTVQAKSRSASSASLGARRVTVRSSDGSRAGRVPVLGQEAAGDRSQLAAGAARIGHVVEQEQAQVGLGGEGAARGRVGAGCDHDLGEELGDGAAASPSIGRLQATMPPKALIGSQASAWA